MQRLLIPRTGGIAGIGIAVVQIAMGAFFASVSLGKFVDHAAEAVDFERYGVPLPEFSVYGVGAVELVGGRRPGGSTVARSASVWPRPRSCSCSSSCGRVRARSHSISA